MPIVENDSGGKDALCDYCGNFVCKADAAYLKHNGFDTGKPKINIECKGCWIAYLQGGIQVKGFGTVSATQVQKAQEEQAMAAANSRRTRITVDELSQKINWAGIEDAIKRGEFKINKTATDLNANPVELRELIEDHFAVRDAEGNVTGSQIKFVRGRKGGVYWNA
jgi:hypothetical protein